MFLHADNQCQSETCGLTVSQSAQASYAPRLLIACCTMWSCAKLTSHSYAPGGHQDHEGSICTNPSHQVRPTESQLRDRCFEVPAQRTNTGMCVRPRSPATADSSACRPHPSPQGLANSTALHGWASSKRCFKQTRWLHVAHCTEPENVSLALQPSTGHRGFFLASFARTASVQAVVAICFSRVIWKSSSGFTRRGVSHNWHSSTRASFL